jgi:secreted PhoX family phosphatase
MGGRDEKDKWIVRSQAGIGQTLEEVLALRISRRGMLKTLAIGGSLVLIGSSLSAVEEALAANPGLKFKAVKPTDPNFDDVVVPEGYYARTLIRWGEPLYADAPDFDVWLQTPEAQVKQFGYNCDFVGFLPLPYGSNNSNRGLLVVNHEYTNEELMFPKYDVENPTRNQVDVGIAAHGMSVVEVVRAPDGTWSYVRNSPFNRRVSGFSATRLSGPAAGHPWMRTSTDPGADAILGTLNNCAGGKTPWGTVVSGEENFHQYFANLNGLDRNDARYAVHRRYGMPTAESERKWERFHSRFDISKEPNEGFRFGWCVEIDPYDPSRPVVKRTALGRFRHEGATFVIARDGRVVGYQGDDAQFEYVYKFVTNGKFNPRNREANMNLLDDGVLYVAKFNADGTGEWLPLVYGQGPLTPENGFRSQGDVLINTRLAADLVGATKMDRPEDVEVNPVNKKVYIALTNNTRRGASSQPGVDAANPRPNNAWGHIIELTERNDDHAATTFRWEIFILAGLPSQPDTYFAGFDKSKVSPIGAPDNVAFDNQGNLWIATDGAPRAIKFNDGLFAVPVSGSQRGNLQQFFSSVAGSEVCGPEFTPDNRTLFLAIQHPGEGSTFENPSSTWPDRQGLPRPSVITVQRFDSGVIGL